MGEYIVLDFGKSSEVKQNTSALISNWIRLSRFLRNLSRASLLDVLQNAYLPKTVGGVRRRVHRPRGPQYGGSGLKDSLLLKPL